MSKEQINLDIEINKFKKFISIQEIKDPFFLNNESLFQNNEITTFGFGKKL